MNELLSAEAIYYGVTLSINILVLVSVYAVLVKKLPLWITWPIPVITSISTLLLFVFTPLTPLLLSSLISIYLGWKLSKLNYVEKTGWKPIVVMMLIPLIFSVVTCSTNLLANSNAIKSVIGMMLYTKIDLMVQFIALISILYFDYLKTVLSKMTIATIALGTEGLGYFKWILVCYCCMAPSFYFLFYVSSIFLTGLILYGAFITNKDRTCPLPLTVITFLVWSLTLFLNTYEILHADYSGCHFS